MLTNPNDIDSVDYSEHVFIGQVVANNDPLKLERVKVRITGLYEGQVEDLPWCAPKYSKAFGNKAGVGVFSVPSVGTWLFVELQNGDAHFPLYTGSPVQTKADLPEADVNYPNRYGLKDPAGNLFYVDTTPGSVVVHFQHVSGTQLTINNNGSVNLQAVDTITSVAPTWNHTGNVNITGDVSITGNQDVDGNVDVTGTVDALIDVKAGPLDISLVTHRHAGVTPGGGTSGIPIP